PAISCIRTARAISPSAIPSISACSKHCRGGKPRNSGRKRAFAGPKTDPALCRILSVRRRCERRTGVERRMRVSHWIEREARNIGMALLVVGGLTVIMVGLTVEAGLAHVSVLYRIPVMIAATRWRLAAALAAALPGAASAFFFYPPLYSFYIKDPQEVVDLTLFVFVAVITRQLASRLKLQLEIARRRE